jgi:hypothetical protein
VAATHLHASIAYAAVALCYASVYAAIVAVEAMHVHVSIVQLLTHCNESVFKLLMLCYCCMYTPSWVMQCSLCYNMYSLESSC